jgi:Putative auto-transporter adhesin, head GIN domain
LQENVPMNRFLFAALVLINGVPATAQSLNASPYQTRDDAIEPVERVEIRGALKVSIYPSDGDASVRFYGPAEMIADAQATIVDGTLIIAYRDGKPWSWESGAGTNVVIKLPRVSSVKAVGPAEVTVVEPLSDEFSVATAGAGRIAVSNLAAKKVRAATGGAGSITLEGTSDLAQFAVGGAGSIEGKRLRTAMADIAIGGAGSVYADVSDRVNVAKGGAGRVEIVGGAACTISPPDARGVECR